MPESRFANGNILPSTVVKLDTTTAGGKVLQATSGSSPIWGIAMEGENEPPFGALDTGYAAVAGETLKVYTYPDKEVWAVVSANSTGVLAGDLLTTDSTSGVISTTTTTNWIIAQAKTSGNAGELITVDMREPQLY